MKELRIKALYWLDECLCGLTLQFKEYCTCMHTWFKRYYNGSK